MLLQYLLVKFLQSNRTNSIRIRGRESEMRERERLTIAIGLHCYGGREVPRSAQCELKNQGNQGYNSVQGQSPQNWEVTAQEAGALMSKGKRRRMSQLKKREFTVPLPFCSIWSLNGLDDTNPHW